MKYLAIFVYLLSFSLLAQVNSKRAKVILIDKDIDSKELEKKYDVERPVEPNRILPTIQERDNLFQGIKLPGEWDELKKDIFFMELKEISLEELVNKYPEIKKSDLKNLKDKRK